MTQKTTGQAVVELLELHSPAFQLKSGTEQLRSSEQLLSGTACRTDHITRSSHASSLGVLRYLSETVTRENTTLETGGGWSTCVFAACSGKHICVNPDVTANEMIQRFLDEHGVSIGKLVFLNDTSDSVLPTLDRSCKIDVALIDGNHSFPLPIVDWHYIDLHLQRDGIVLVDDSHIHSVAVLCEYLSLEETYTKVTDIGNTAVFRKLAGQRVWGWSDQAFNRLESHRRNLPAVSHLKTVIKRVYRGLRST
jgi:hypothetical protein